MGKRKIDIRSLQTMNTYQVDLYGGIHQSSYRLPVLVDSGSPELASFSARLASKATSKTIATNVAICMLSKPVTLIGGTMVGGTMVGGKMEAVKR